MRRDERQLYQKTYYDSGTYYAGTAPDGTYTRDGWYYYAGSITNYGTAYDRTYYVGYTGAGTYTIKYGGSYYKGSNANYTYGYKSYYTGTATENNYRYKSFQNFIGTSGNPVAYYYTYSSGLAYLPKYVQYRHEWKVMAYTLNASTYYVPNYVADIESPTYRTSEYRRPERKMKEVWEYWSTPGGALARDDNGKEMVYVYFTYGSTWGHDTLIYTNIPPECVDGYMKYSSREYYVNTAHTCSYAALEYVSSYTYNTYEYKKYSYKSGTYTRYYGYYYYSAENYKMYYSYYRYTYPSSYTRTYGYYYYYYANYRQYYQYYYAGPFTSNYYMYARTYLYK